MVVDDDPGLLKLVSGFLEYGGFSVVKADSAAEALSLLEETQPDLFVLDIMMPEMNGIELTQYLRSQPETIQTAILILSARSDLATIEEAFEAGTDDYLVKPVLPRELIEKVHSMLKVRVGE
jgi:DNA-binding response OmpR family regulator